MNNSPQSRPNYLSLSALLFTLTLLMLACGDKSTDSVSQHDSASRDQILINEGWKFYKYEGSGRPDFLIYETRPEVKNYQDDKPADAEPTDAEQINPDNRGLKPWILPSANDFIVDASKNTRPEGFPAQNFPFVSADFDDSSWEDVDLPHDWAINGPFFIGEDVAVGGSMGRLPSPGVGWYRKTLEFSTSDAGRRVYIEFEGAMSYAMVWLNGKLVGGWPYGYASWQLDLTPYMQVGQNQLSVRLDNPPDSSRWYPGGGLYRNVWLIKTAPVHVNQWGTFVTTPEVSEQSATIKLALTIKNTAKQQTSVDAYSTLYELCNEENSVATIEQKNITVGAEHSTTAEASVQISKPRLWGPPPTQTPHLYRLVTELKNNGKLLDRYETTFGVRQLEFNPDKGLFVNGEHVPIQGVNQHHDLGPLGAAFNIKAAKRQLELLREMGVNAIRTAHNPPAPELLDLTDRMGFLVVNEIFDVWERKKTPLDTHLIFPDWHEADLRAFIRRDRNHPSVIIWSVGNEVGEQYTEAAGTKVAERLHNIAKSEDPTRPTTAAMNFAKPPMAITGVMDAVSLNYQGEGIRHAPAYKGLKGITAEPQFPNFHQAHPEKMILSSEMSAAVSTRGEYLFPVSSELSAPVKDGEGGDAKNKIVSAYELYTTPFGSSADKVLASLEQHPYVAGGFIWSGWDYLGEPTPYYSARSSYFGVIDLAGFKKDRFYLYQSHWRPDHPMVHILPHWNWPGREGEVTPVHVFTSGDEVELFLNGESQGKKQKQQYQHRLRWDEAVYQPGELKAVAYKNGKPWAEKTLVTTGKPAKLQLQSEDRTIVSNGHDLTFITVKIIDKNGNFVANAKETISFSVDGPAEIIATANGDPTNMVPFYEETRETFNGLMLVVMRGIKGMSGEFAVHAISLTGGLETGSLLMTAVEDKSSVSTK